MRIAQIPGAHLLFSPELINTPASISLMCYLLTEGLVRRGHKVTLFATSDSKTSAKLPPGLISWNYIKKYVKTDEDRIKLFKNFCQLILSQVENFDINHLHESIMFGAAQFLKEMKIKTPFISTLHSPTLPTNYRNLKDLMWVATSKKQIQNNPDMNFVGYVYNGLPIELFPFNEKPKDYLLWLGRIGPTKGTLDAIRMARKIKRKLLIIGYFSYFPPHRKYAEKVKKEIKKNKNVTYLGFIKNFERKTQFLKNAYCLLFPIKWEEPFGIVMVEAMACGTPVIAFNRGAVPEVVKDGITGFLVKNQQEMIRAIEKVKTLDRKKCREWVEQNFTVEKMVQGYEKIYQKVIEKYGKR